MKKSRWDYSFVMRKEAIRKAINFGKTFPLPTSSPKIGYIGCAKAYNSGPVDKFPWFTEWHSCE